MTYLVMETRSSFAIVLDETGRFIKAANMGYEVGQKVKHIIEMDIQEQIYEEDTETVFLQEEGKITAARKKIKRAAAVISALAACMVLILTNVLGQDTQTYASVMLTINPQVKIEVNRSDKVLELTALNEDGKILIDGYVYKKKDIHCAVEELLDRAVDMGFLKEGGQVRLYIDADDDEWIFNTEKSLKKQIDQYRYEDISIVSQVTSRLDGKSDSYDDMQNIIETEAEDEDDLDEKYDKHFENIYEDRKDERDDDEEDDDEDEDGNNEVDEDGVVLEYK